MAGRKLYLGTAEGPGGPDMRVQKKLSEVSWRGLTGMLSSEIADVIFHRDGLELFDALNS
jgi:hypothetical protein